MGAYLSSLFTHVDGRGRDGAGVSVGTLWGVRGLASVQLLPCQTSLLGHEELHPLPAAITVNMNKLRQAVIVNPTAATVNTNKLTQALIGRKPRACERWPRVLNSFHTKKQYCKYQ